MSKDLHPFGLTFSLETAEQIAALGLTARRENSDGVALVVTPNIEHISRLRRSPALMQAYCNAEITVCDGWPVHRYAQLCGVEVDRVTGCEIVERLMGSQSYQQWHRMFFVLDRPETAEATRAWANQHGMAERVEIEIPPFGFDDDDKYCRELADKIRTHGTTLLLMAVGAPRSEIFVDRYRSLLPPCWAYCVGQAVKIALGLVERAPKSWQSLGLEWLWRLCQEPKRLAKRYLVSSFGFIFAVIEDRRRPSRGARRVRA
jgi:N-acetylglucosaminyldiphosphoundecaprenol N-acetyl-beta-D-mannosaminyltransferase